MKSEEKGVVIMDEKDYIVWILGEEFRVSGTTRWKAISNAAHKYSDKYPGRYKLSLLMVIARTRQLPEVTLEVK